jgi:hypothetical protein
MRVVLSIIFSFAVRVPGLYDTSYQWRPLHTEMTAYWFVMEGINILNYQTPFFGPPWQIPIEFPLFQATAAIIFKAGLGDVDFVCRLTALIYFYISALFLYLLCKKIFSDNQTIFLILSLYLWLPFNIHYSTEPLIDYLALTLTLAYLYFILRWLDTRASFSNVLLATICGSLGVLVKPTTIPVVVVPIIIFVLRDILAVYWQDFKPPVDLQNLLKKVRAQQSYWLTLLLMAIIPLLIGMMWTRHTDLIKGNSVFTQWHTSRAMVNWYFGTWALRTDQDVWINYISEAQRLFLPYGLYIFAVLGIFIAGSIILPRETAEIRLFIISVSASLGVVLAIFLGLYQQQYYYISFSASMAILGGYGLARFWQSKQKGHILTLVFASWAIIFLALNTKDYKTLRTIAVSENRKFEKTLARVQKVQKYVPPDKWVVVVAYDWDPVYVYPLQRKAMVVTPRELNKPLCEVLDDERFTVVVVADRDYERNDELLSYTFQCFSSQNEILPGVFVVKQ